MANPMFSSWENINGVQGVTVAVTLRKNGADTAITASLTGANTTANDISHTAAFSAGDLINFKLVTSASQPSLFLGLMIAASAPAA